MPYTYQLRNRRQLKRLALTSLLLAGLLLLLVITPARIQGWTGRSAFIAPLEELVTLVVEDGVLPAPKKSGAAPTGFLGLPGAQTGDQLALSEVRDCEACDWGWSDGVSGQPDASGDWLTRLEGAENSSSRALHSLVSQQSANPLSSWARAGSPGGLGGGGGLASGAGGGGGGAGGASQEPVADELVADLAPTAAPLTETSLDAAASEPALIASSGGGPRGQASGRAPGSAAEASAPEGSAGETSAPETSASDDVAPVGNEPGNLLLSPIDPAVGLSPGGTQSGEPDGTGDSQGDSIVSDALVNGPVGAETIYAPDEPQLVSELLDLDALSSAPDAGPVLSDAVPEPTELILMGLALSAMVYRLRRATPR